MNWRMRYISHLRDQDLSLSKGLTSRDILNMRPEDFWRSKIYNWVQHIQRVLINCTKLLTERSTTIAYQNTTGLNSKTHDLFKSVPHCESKLIVVTETWRSRMGCAINIVYRNDRNLSRGECVSFRDKTWYNIHKIGFEWIWGTDSRNCFWTVSFTSITFGYFYN